MWFHGPYVFVTFDEVHWMRTRANSLWLCDVCINGSLFNTEAMLTSLLEKHDSKILNESMKMLGAKTEETVPKIIQETVQSHIRIK